MKSGTGYAKINGARLYYEVAGSGRPLVMIHAGIADCRMWDHEFEVFAGAHLVMRFDMRGYGKSPPVEGEFNIQDDLTALLEALEIPPPAILMGCSMGGGLAIDYALAQPEKVAALILVGSGPPGLELDVEGPDELFAQSEAAFQAGELDRVAELDMQIWFDGIGRNTQEVDALVRRKAYDMARLVTEHEYKDIGKHIRKSTEKPAAEQLPELTVPVLAVVGENDLPYLRLAADYMVEHLPNASKLLIPNAGHLPNMEHPKLFRALVAGFLNRI
ncbi:MAG: alpha/beta hydrolase [Chloroflexi bacterium]|nr:alpha/beta hydrolase [Chloroflexota bacterium]